MKAYLNNDKANSIKNKNNRKTTKFCKFCNRFYYIKESCFKKYLELTSKKASKSND